MDRNIYSSSGNPPRWVDAILANNSMNSDSTVQATPPASLSDAVADTHAPQGATECHYAEHSSEKDKPSPEEEESVPRVNCRYPSVTTPKTLKTRVKPFRKEGVMVQTELYLYSYLYCVLYRIYSSVGLFYCT